MDTEFQLNKILFLGQISRRSTTWHELPVLCLRVHMRNFKNAEKQVRFHVKWPIQFEVLNEYETVDLFVKLSNIKFNGDPFWVFRVYTLSLNSKKSKALCKNRLISSVNWYL